MSQSRNKRSRGSSSARRPDSSTPRPVRQPVQAESVPSRSQSVRQQVDRKLPPFTVRRYVAIWLLGMIPLVLVLLFLLRPWANSSSNTQPSGTSLPASQGDTSTGAGAIVTQTATSAGSTPDGTANAFSNETPVSQEGTTPGSVAVSTPSPMATVGGTGGATPAPGEGKYLVIETSKGRIVAKLHDAPSAGVVGTIANFEAKAGANEFNGRTFHRVEDWVIQGGDPLGNGTGGGDMPSEYNSLPFVAGALGIARGQDPAINNDSQFFIVKKDSTFLDGQYTNWGQVVEGMDVVNSIAIGDKIEAFRIETRAVK